MKGLLLFFSLIIALCPLSAEGGQSEISALNDSGRVTSYNIDLTKDNAPFPFSIGIEVDTEEASSAEAGVSLKMQNGKAVNKENFRVKWECWTAKGIKLSMSITPLRYTGTDTASHPDIHWTLSGKDTVFFLKEKRRFQFIQVKLKLSNFTINRSASFRKLLINRNLA